MSGVACLVSGRRKRLALGALAALALAGCGGSERANSDGRRILRVAYEREIDVLNPFTSQNLVDIGFSMIEGLVTTDELNRYVPVLATTIPTRENGLVVSREGGGMDVTWPLHTGVRWHDGEPFTSRDVCFTWKFVTSAGSETYNREQYLGITGCDAPDDSTVVFHWKTAYAYHDGLFEAILPEHVLGSMTTEEIVNFEPYNRGSRTVGTGPFRFVEWKAGEYLRVVRNDRYWRGNGEPAIDEIVWSFIPDANTRWNALLSGRYHYGRILPTQVHAAEQLKDFEVYLTSSNSVMHFDLSLTTANGKALFSDIRVRQALFQAIDRQAIADRLMEGTVTIAETPINPSSRFHNPAVLAATHDPSAAAQLLDEAGWRPGVDGVRAKGGRRLAFTVLNRAGASDRIAVAQVIQAQLKAIGVEVRFQTLESAAWTERWRRREWEAVVSAWFLPADPSLTNLYGCDGANNMTGFCDARLDGLLERADRTLSVPERRTYLDQAQMRLAESARTLPLYYNVVPEVVSRKVGNFRGSATNFGSFWNLHAWTLAP